MKESDKCLKIERKREEKIFETDCSMLRGVEKGGDLAC